MKLFVTILGGFLLCLPFITSGQKACLEGSCVPWSECKSLTELMKKAKRQNKYTVAEKKFKKLLCDYNLREDRAYFCCADKEEDKNKNYYNSLKNHRNRDLFGPEKVACGNYNYNPGSYNSNFNNASLFEISWSAVIKYNGKIISSGTLINSRYVLTNARYAKYLANGMRNVEIVLGDYDLSKYRDCVTFKNGRTECSTAKSVGVVGVYPHPYFNEKDLTNNIALIRLNEEIESTVNIEPICLPFNEEVPLLPIEYDVYGHGISLRSGSESNITLRNTVKFMDNYECALEYKKGNQKIKIDDNVVCVKPKKLPPVCVTDDGGALSQTVGVQYQVGVSSFADGVCSLKLPFVFTRIDHYLKWILDTVRK
ncbi:serine protease grass-like [Leptopilina heterotoma]|uniref:serine protease grass-like n=1 Tax=Leptopilina heterotoma TaxID=63436 RepID=UPI001CA92166|nr:serine protease grass-like [Leptopilina heterotoma]